MTLADAEISLPRIISRDAARKAAVRSKRGEFKVNYDRVADKPVGRMCVPVRLLHRIEYSIWIFKRRKASGAAKSREAVCEVSDRNSFRLETKPFRVDDLVTIRR